MGKSIKTRIFARLNANRLVSGLQRLLGSELKPKSWVFIVGCYNSGTTLLDQMLSQHPELSCLEDEGVMLTNELNRPEDFGWTRMWHKCQDLVSYTGLNAEEQDRKSAIIKRHWSWFYRRDRRSILVEKSIANTARIDFFARNFQPAYFIHIVRNGYAVAEGIRRKARPENYGNHEYGKQYPIGLCIDQWRTSYREVNEAKDSLPNFLEIRYEDLCDDTEGTLRRVCDFLGIKAFPGSALTKEYSVHQIESGVSNQNSRSFDSLSEEDIRTIESRAGALLDALEYSLGDKEVR